MDEVREHVKKKLAFLAVGVGGGATPAEIFSLAHVLKWAVFKICSLFSGTSSGPLSLQGCQVSFD